MPEPVKRYRIKTQLIEAEYVLAADYDALMTKKEELRQENIALRITLGAEENETTRLREQIKEARELINDLKRRLERVPIQINDFDLTARACAFLKRTEGA